MLTVRLRRRAPLVLTALVAVAIAAPLGAFASHQFTDVPDSNPFHADIDALADSGVTTGCGGTNYCPDDFVTREQMAAFMNRLGALSPSKTPVVNADKLDGLDSTEFVKDTDAIDADTLGGVGPFGYLPAATIEMNQAGGWDVSSGSGTVRNSSAGSLVTATGAGDIGVVLGVTGPTFIGGLTYTLKSAEICFGSNAGITVTVKETGMDAITGAGNDTSRFDGSDTVLSVQACRSMTFTSPPTTQHSYSVRATLGFSGAGTIIIGEVRTTWTLAAAVG